MLVPLRERVYKWEKHNSQLRLLYEAMQLRFVAKMPATYSVDDIPAPMHSRYSVDVPATAFIFIYVLASYSAA